MEKSPSPVYGARLELVYGLIAHRGFESLLLRQRGIHAAENVLAAMQGHFFANFQKFFSIQIQT